MRENAATQRSVFRRGKIRGLREAVRTLNHLAERAPTPTAIAWLRDVAAQILEAKIERLTPPPVPPARARAERLLARTLREG